jgi:hypothetical protein
MTRPSFADYGTYGESAHPDLWDGVVGYWTPCLGPTGTRLHDVSRFNNWGTLTNMDAATDWVIDGGQYALDFDGSNDHVVTLSRGTSSSTRTVSLWMKYTGPGTGFRCAFDYGVVGTIGQRLFVGYNGQNIIMDRFGGGLAVSGYYDLAWHHVVVTDSLGNYSLFVDGKLGASGSQASAPTLGTVYLGRAIDGAYFVGQVDDIGIYNRALTANEIRSLYNLGRGGMLERRRRRLFYSMQADVVRSYLFLNRGQVIGGGTL